MLYNNFKNSDTSTSHNIRLLYLLLLLISWITIFTVTRWSYQQYLPSSSGSISVDTFLSSTKDNFANQKKFAFNIEEETTILLSLINLPANLLEFFTLNTDLHLPIRGSQINEPPEIKSPETPEIYSRLNFSRLHEPLHWASSLREKTMSLRFIYHFIKYGISPMAKDNLGRTFLHILLDTDTNITPAEFHDIALLLVSKKLTKIFNMAASDSLKLSPIQLAVKNVEVKLESLKLLQLHGVNFNIYDNFDSNLIVLALRGNRSPKLLSDLIDLGVDMRKVDKLNRNLVHEAAQHCNINALALFYQKGLEVNGKDLNGNNALNLAAAFGTGECLETFKFLIRHDVNKDNVNLNGNSPVTILLRRYEKKDFTMSDIELVKEYFDML